ncbi:MAG TPA: hypothetical protein VN632_07275 [Stellaceae bacterium]|nr:hypothetical protein [Stellaceae bacterium]
MQPNASERRFRSAVKHGWIRFVGATREKRPFGLRRRHKHHAAIFPFFDPVDPVELTVMTLNILAPALSRANTTGKKVTVTVPDERTAEIFRAALDQSRHVRATDRLIDIVIAEAEEPRELPRAPRHAH